MCLAVPMRVIAIDDETVTVELDGVRQRARRELVDGVRLGDHVIVHAGYAISILDPDAATASLELFAELAAEGAGYAT